MSAKRIKLMTLTVYQQ